MNVFCRVVMCEFYRIFASGFDISVIQCFFFNFEFPWVEEKMHHSVSM